jgi:hypothetical protein
MVQWISTKLGNFEYFRGLTARGYATLCVALVLIKLKKQNIKMGSYCINIIIALIYEFA